MDRSLTYAALSKLKLPAEHAACFACPSFVNATTDEDDVTKSISDAKMQGPYLVKTFRACGSAESHRMAIVFSPKDVATCGVPRPFCCQRYVNHQAVLWKIYVLDSMIRIVPRASTPDVVTEQDAHDFDSQALSKATIAPSPDVSAPSMEFVRAVAEAITAQMGISLFGFDLIHEKGVPTTPVPDTGLS